MTRIIRSSLKIVLCDRDNNNSVSNKQRVFILV